MSIFDRILSLLIYLVFLVPTVFITFLAERRIKRNRKRAFVAYSIVAIFLPCILATFRGETVGTDIFVYAKPAYLLAKSASSFQQLLYSQTRFELGYMAMAYVSAHLFRSFNVMLFFTQLLIVVPIYVAAFKNRDSIPAWSTMLCFFSFFYLMTFNIMREGISVAFVVLSYFYLFENRWIKAILFTIVGAMFHSSAIVGFLLGVFVVILERIDKKRVRIVLILLAVVAVPLIMKNWKTAFEVLLSLRILPEKYAFYIRRMTNSYMIGLNRAYFYKMVCRCSAYGGAYYFLRNSNYFQNDKVGRFIRTGTFIGLLIYTSVLLMLKSGYGYRISLYLEMLLVFWVSGLNSGIKINGLRKVPIRVVAMFGIVIFWFFVAYVWRGFHATMPFYFQVYTY